MKNHQTQVVYFRIRIQTLHQYAQPAIYIYQHQRIHLQNNKIHHQDFRNEKDIH